MSNWRTRSEQRRSGSPRPHCGLLYVPGANSLGALEQCLTHALHPARRLVASRSTRFLQCRVEGSRWRFRRSGRTPRLALSALSDGIVRSISLALRRPLDGCADGLDDLLADLAVLGLFDAFGGSARRASRAASRTCLSLSRIASRSAIASPVRWRLREGLLARKTPLAVWLGCLARRELVLSAPRPRTLIASRGHLICGASVHPTSGERNRLSDSPQIARSRSRMRESRPCAGGTV